MPKNGFTTITVRDSCKKSLNENYNKNREELRLRGIDSLSAYIEFLSKENKMTGIDDLREIMCIISQSLIIQNDLHLQSNTRTDLTKQQFNIKQHMYDYLKKFQEQH
jgi:hypothetical protein